MSNTGTHTSSFLLYLEIYMIVVLFIIIITIGDVNMTDQPLGFPMRQR